jgi:uncharacterized protein YqiB (DUF1249 family)
MDWLPNEDGSLYFVEQVLPRVKLVLPDVRLTIVGRNPFPRLVELNRQDPAITVIGRVDDVRPYVERAGAEGLPVLDGQHLLFADSPEDFASAVVRVLTDARLARELGAQEAATVRERFGWGNVPMRFSLICQNALQEFQQQKGKTVSAERRDAIA